MSSNTEPSVNYSDPTDQRFFPKVNQSKRLSGIGYALLTLVCAGSLGVSGVSYVLRDSDKRVVELIQTAVIAVFFLPLCASTFFLFTLKPNRAGLHKCIFATVVGVLFTLCSLIFGIVVTVQILRQSSETPHKGLRTVSMIIHFVNAVFGVCFVCVNRPLLKALRWSNRSPERNGAAVAYSNPTWERRPGTVNTTHGLVKLDRSGRRVSDGANT